jgi:hypothetical protein
MRSADVLQYVTASAVRSLPWMLRTAVIDRDRHDQDGE